MTDEIVAWQRIFALFQNELAHAAATMLARGTAADRLAEQIDERIALLRREIEMAGHDATGSVHRSPRT